MVFTIKYRAFRFQFSHHPILWNVESRWTKSQSIGKKPKKVGTLRHDGDRTDRIDITMVIAHLNGMLEVFHMGPAKPCSYMGMDQYLLIPFLVGWTSIYQLFWCSPGAQGFDPSPYSRSATKPNHVPQPLDASHKPYWSKSCLTLRGLSIAGCTRDGNPVILQGFCDSCQSFPNGTQIHTAWWKDVKGCERMWKDEASNPFKSFNLCFKTSTIINLSYLVDHPTVSSWFHPPDLSHLSGEHPPRIPGINEVGVLRISQEIHLFNDGW